MRLPCDMITPFGSPVVPDVYMMSASWFGSLWYSGVALPSPLAHTSAKECVPSSSSPAGSESV